jgi:hypothetical protein
MTKKETIFKHWEALNIASPFGICIETGWYFGIFCDGIDDIKELYGDSILELMDFEIEHDGLGKFRPKSLRGIEDNNGWIKIEKVEDLPTNGIYQVIHRDSGKIIICPIWNLLNDLKHLQYIVEQFSHYKPIEEEKKPLY